MQKAHEILEDPEVALQLPPGATVEHALVVVQYRDLEQDGTARLAFVWDTELPPWVAYGMVAHVQDHVTFEVAEEALDPDEDEY